MILNFRTNQSGQKVQTQIRLLLEGDYNNILGIRKLRTFEVV